ncbi:marginal zone B- and B1-cell-specific protein [Falco biarmicus]|uniref:marginal zone B- and B1-cell-specific protein n=1 Tax=Falco rusticolus TaxID=120794 RepID=UPI0018869DBD|nr:marginal zone B- and B1-cell-specific protein [Falco rusticolus]XP_055574658.1 marginal zone B- and B1-cell-specific protein [Falco cherrug]XP_055668900.1 marginal zone B- and B1-cell-specific protein [Falco peregrinus]XP_056206169.1 marginal zone B- and B1-cell-specific protein [Falco biarmicus]
MLLALAAWLALSLLVVTGSERCEGPPATASRSMPAPQLSPEERLSPHMPESLRCDACYAIAFQIEEQLRRAEGKVGRKVLSESDYTEVLERSCSQGWDSYGVQELDGKKRLAGPGLPGQEPMTVMVMGGPWPGRLSKMCHSHVGERGEAQIYGAHRRGPAALRELLCHGDKGACAGGKAGVPAPPKALQNEL